MVYDWLYDADDDDDDDEHGHEYLKLLNCILACYNLLADYLFI